MGKKSRRNRNRKLYREKEQRPSDNQSTKSSKVVSANFIPLAKLIKANLLLLGIFFFIVFIAYSGLIGSEFITADDTTSIVNNPQVQDLNGSLATLELTPIYNAVFFNLFNKTTLGFRLFAIFMHSINTFLVFLLVRRLYSEKIALMVAFLFSVHPTISEALNWISANGYLFIGFFTFSTILLFLEYRFTNDRKYIYYSSGLFIFALLFFRSPWLLIIPPILALIDLTHVTNKDDQKFTLPIASYFKDYLGIIIGTVGYGIYSYFKQYTARLYNFTDLYFDPEKADPLLKRLPYSVYKALELLLFLLNLAYFMKVK